MRSHVFIKQKNKQYNQKITNSNLFQTFFLISKQKFLEVKKILEILDKRIKALKSYSQRIDEYLKTLFIIIGKQTEIRLSPEIVREYETTIIFLVPVLVLQIFTFILLTSCF